MAAHRAVRELTGATGSRAPSLRSDHHRGCLAYGEALRASGPRPAVPVPAVLRDWLAEDHPVWLVIRVVEDHMDTSAFHADRGGKGWCCPPCSKAPGMRLNFLQQILVPDEHIVHTDVVDAVGGAQDPNDGAGGQGLHDECRILYPGVIIGRLRFQLQGVPAPPAAHPPADTYPDAP